MSPSEIPRKFTFVGGPSSKRRRGAPPTSPSSQSMSMVMMTKAATATKPDGVQIVSQPTSTIHEKPHTNSSPESNNSDNASGSVSGHDAAIANVASVQTTFAVESQDPPTIALPSRFEFVGPQLGWQVVGDTFEFNDPFSLFGAPFNLPTSSDQGLTSDMPVRSSTDSSGRHIIQGQDPSFTSVRKNVPLEDSSESTEDVERDLGPETEGYGLIP
ncbi:hypothetical protein J3F84DRAFT_379086 [Trichoderma pleuroticola]